MTIYIALLLGINVGGKNKIKMNDLRHLLETVGLTHVETYIQSGNVIFESNEIEDVLRRKIEYEIETNFGFSSVALLRTISELEQLIRDCPFSQEEVMEAESLNSEGKSLYVSFLTQSPSPEKIMQLNIYKNEGEEYKIINRDVYLLFRHSIRNSKIANNLQKLDTSATVRNWNSINKIYELAKLR